MINKVSDFTLKNKLLLGLGYLFVALGIIGMILPVMPTTVFFILALTCFSRSSPKLTAWLLNHPKFGATLRNWQQHHVVPNKAKWFASLGMIAGFGLVIVATPPYWVVCSVATIKIAVIGFLLSRPSTPEQEQTLYQLCFSVLATCAFASTLFLLMLVK